MNYFRTATHIIFFLFGLSGILAAQDAVQTWQVQKYDISATLPQGEKDRSMVSHAVLALKNVSGKQAASLTLRISPAAEVTAIRINDAVTDFSKSEEKVGSAGSLQRILMRFPGFAADTVITAAVDYKLTVKDNSGLSDLSPAGTQFLPLSYWYPTPTSWFFTRGADRAAFKIKIGGGSGLTTVSSGSNVAGAFEQKFGGQPFFVSGNWETVNSNGVDVYLRSGTAADGQKRAAELSSLFSEARTFAAGILGTPPDEPLRIVSVRRGAGFTGAGTVLVEDAVFRRPKIDSQTAMSIAEAAAKLWIGNSVAATGDGHGVILEGLVRFIATEFLETKYGKDIADIERMRQRAAFAAISKRGVSLMQVTPLDEFYYGEVANNGAMAWRLLAKLVGKKAFSDTLKANMGDGNLSISELRRAFFENKELLDYLLEKTTDMNLLVGLPQQSGGEAKVALRNSGSIDATVTVSATTANGQKIETPTTIKALSYGDVVFKSAGTVTRVEVDSEKLYPQMEYSDDVAPRETTDTDLLLAVKRNFDKQDFAGAESTARTVLSSMPRFDDVRILLGRSLAALGRSADAEKEFKAVLDEKLPTSRSLAWANVGLSEIAVKANQNDQATKYAESAILADAEYGATLAARNLRNKVGAASSIDPSVKAFFVDFDRAIVSNRKADVEALVVSGEVSKFVGGVSGSSEQWQTQIKQVDRLDANSVLVETSLNIKMLTRDPESGLAVFRLTKIGGSWKLSAVDMFEVR